MHSWLVSQANLRGHLGAFEAEDGGRTLDPRLSQEQLIVGLVGPWAPVDGRTYKLVLRIMQTGQLDPLLLKRLARQERAEFMLHWLLERVPESEQNEPVRILSGLFADPPRGDRGVDYLLDPARWIRRPATASNLWHAKRR